MFRVAYQNEVGHSKGEINSGESIVETQGYVSAEKQITALIRAGEQLVAYRKEMFDFGEGEEVPDDAEDPTRRPNYDLADAHEDAQAIGRRNRSRRRNKEEVRSAADTTDALTDVKETDVEETSE